MAENFMLVSHAIQAEIDTTPNSSTRTWVIFGNGIENFAEALNEVVQQYFFFADHGFARNYVTGLAPAYTCSGRRIIGDAAQDYIFNAARKFGLMVERNTNFRISIGQADGSVMQITAGVTIANMSDLGGATTDGSAVSFEVRINGKPVVETVIPGSALTVAVAGGTVTVTPAQPTAGCKYVIAYGTPAPVADVGDIITGWNDFNAETEYTFPAGATVVVAEIAVSTNVVTAVGQATVS